MLVVVMLITTRDGPPRLRAAAIAAGVGAASFSFSRTALIALAVALVAAAVARAGPLGAFRSAMRGLRARPAVVAPILLVAMIVIARSVSLDAIPERNSLDTRGFYNEVAVQIVGGEGPVGAGNLVLAQQRLGYSAVLSDPAHDVFLIALAELGAPGVIAWLGFFGILGAIAWRRRRDPSGRTGPLLAAAVLLPVLLLDHYLWTQPPGRTLLAFTVAVLVSADKLRPIHRVARSPGRPRNAWCHRDIRRSIGARARPSTLSASSMTPA